MTPKDTPNNVRQLAEKIIACINGNCNCETHLPNEQEHIQSLLAAFQDEVVKDDRAKHNNRVDDVVKEIRAQARAEGYEEGLAKGQGAHSPIADNRVSNAAYWARKEAFEQAAKIAHDVCAGCDEDGDCCPSSNHRAEDRIRQAARESK